MRWAGSGRSVKDRLKEFEMHAVDLTEGAVLEKGCVYVVPLMERITLPATMSAVANAKSSTGRLDLLTRTITDGGSEFDRIASGYDGPLYAEICPRSFSVLARPGMRLNLLGGFPVATTEDGVETNRKFYGAAVDFEEIADALDVTVFYNTQEIDGVDERDAVPGGKRRRLGQVGRRIECDRLRNEFVALDVVLSGRGHV